MRVLLVVSSSKMAGTERHVVELAAGLHAAGIGVEAACEPGGGGLDQALGDRGVPVHRLALTGPGLARSVAELARISLTFDLVHTHLTHATAAAVAARSIVGRPVVETRHFVTLAHQQRTALRRHVGRWRRAIIDRRLHLTLAPSDAVARQVAGKAVVVPHGIPMTSPRERPPWSSRYLTVGRLEHDRNTGLVLDAFAMADVPTTATLTIVGEGSARAALEGRAARLGIADRVTFTGQVPDVTPHLAAADVFLAPAVEAFGLAALEAMAAGLPVLAVDAGGVAELVRDGETGMLVPGDPARWATAISRFEHDQPLAARMGAAGRRLAEQGFTVERMVQQTVDAYRGVARRSGSGPKVLRLYHSAVVPAWRQRDRELRTNGVDVTLVAPRAWNEGGSVVRLAAGADDFVVGVRTFGAHQALFVYNPWPLWRLMRQHRFDAVDAHEEPYSLATAEVRILAARLQPTARLLVYSGQNLMKRYPWPIRMIESRTLASASAAYVCNQAAGEVLRTKGFTGEVRLLPLGVDTTQFSPPPAPEEGGPFVVGYVGRLTRQKGVDVLIAAMAGEDGYELVVAGDGPERARLEALATNHAVSAAFLGAVSQDALATLYRRVDVLVVPSRPAAVLEQFGRVVVEGMASGVPVVASALGGLPEVLGEAGVLVPPDDVEALAAALRSLAADPERARRLGRLGRQRAQRFSWPEIAAAHRELYEKVLCDSTS
ncbi:MAG: glycosyltransferase family 4 protein [Actinobacteria bacterium]|nr:glycosyltransferase family 4 protein [Actinomycetota bacterium]